MLVPHLRRPLDLYDQGRARHGEEPVEEHDEEEPPDGLVVEEGERPHAAVLGHGLGGGGLALAAAAVAAVAAVVAAVGAVGAAAAGVRG